MDTHTKKVLQLHYESSRGCTMEFFTGLNAQTKLEKSMKSLLKRRIDAVLLNEKHEKVGAVEAGVWWYDPVVFDV